MKFGRYLLILLVFLPIQVMAGSGTTITLTDIDDLLDYSNNNPWIVDAGDTIEFSFSVTGDPFTDLFDVEISTGNPGVMLPPPVDIPESSSTVITGDYTITAADIVANQVSISPVRAFGYWGCDGPCYIESDPPQNYIVTWTNPSADLSITKSDSPDPVAVGDDLTYTITVSNAGPDAAENVVVTDSLPAGVIFQGSTGSCSPGLVCDLGSIGAGQVETFTITVGVTASAAAVITNTASVTSDIPDPNSSNNSEAESTDVIHAATVTVYKDFTDGNPASVPVTLTCTDAWVDGNSDGFATRSASNSNAAVFDLTHVGTGNVCDAVETEPAGYFWSNPFDCEEIGAGPETSHDCEMVNEPIADAEFTVYKDFTDDNTASVQVTLECTSADIDQATKPASESSPAVFHLSYVGYDNHCTATESTPPNYLPDESDCVGVPAGQDSFSSCEITNTRSDLSFTVFKDFTDDSAASVEVSLSCIGATVEQSSMPASHSNPAVFALSRISGWDGPPPSCTATETVPDGYDGDVSDCDHVVLADEDNYCEIINSPSTGRFVVSKDFSDDNPDSVVVTANCTDAVIDDDTQTAAEGRSAVFNLSYVVAGNKCTAKEEVPDGYRPSQNACARVGIDPGESKACRITNTLLEPGETTFTVQKDFSDDNPAEVEVTLTCTAANVDGDTNTSTRPASEISAAVFTLTNVAAGNLCTATEGIVPPGYTADNSACDAVQADPGSASACTISNTLDDPETTFTVRKDFSDDNPAEVEVTLTCSNANVDGDSNSNTRPASESNAAVFNLSNVGSGNLCTATEGIVPPGYETSNSSCDGVMADPGSTRACTIRNTLIGTEDTTFTVRKDFSDDNPAEVPVTLTCSNANVDGDSNSSTRPASESNAAVFNLSSVGSGNRCTAIEGTVPQGYITDNSNCDDVQATQGSNNVCTISNNLLVPVTTFTVQKDFSDDNLAEVSVTLTCTDAGVDGDSNSNTRPASESQPAVFDLSSVGATNRCSATEAAVPPDYEADNSNCDRVPASPGSSNVCKIVNTAVEPGETTFTVQKDFSDDNAASVQVTLACTDATIDGATKSASEASPAVFTLSDVGAGNQCTATEEIPAGYLGLQDDCKDVALNSGEQTTCTIQNVLVDLPAPPGGGGNNPPVIEYVVSTCQDQGNEMDYQLQCNSLVGAALSEDAAVRAAAAVATKEITPDDAVTTRSSGMQTSMVQVAAIDGRLGTLRGGGGAGFSASGFSMGFADATVSGGLLKSFISSFDQNNPDFMQAAAGQNTDPGFIDEFGRWGIWVSGKLVFGKKDLTSYQIDYDFDTAGLTFGMDYMFTEQFVAGIALGYANTNADIGSDHGELDTDGYSVSLYGTWFQGERFYMAGSIGYGSNDYDQLRNVRYNLNSGSGSPYDTIDQTLSASYDGNQFSAALSGGWDFNKNGWTFGPTFSISYINVDVDAYDEILIRSINSPDNVGWAAHIDDQSYKSLQPALGFAFSKPVSRDWGVMIPQGYIDVITETKDGSQLITGSYLGAAQNQKRFELTTDDFEETFARGGLGLGFIFKNNKSAFLMVDADIGRDILQTYYINAGFRWQF